MSERYGVYQYGVNSYSAALNVEGDVISDVATDAVLFGSVNLGEAVASDIVVVLEAFGSVSGGAAAVTNVRTATLLERATSLSASGGYASGVYVDSYAEGKLRINHSVELDIDVLFDVVAFGNVHHGAALISSMVIDSVTEPYESKFWEPMPSVGVWTPTSTLNSIWVIQPNSNPWG